MGFPETMFHILGKKRWVVDDFSMVYHTYFMYQLDIMMAKELGCAKW